MKRQQSSCKESAGVPISTATVCQKLLCIINKVNGAIVVKQFVFFISQILTFSDLYICIYMYMCVYIYIQFLRESMSPRILDFRVIKVPACPPPSLLRAFVHKQIWPPRKFLQSSHVHFFKNRFFSFPNICFGMLKLPHAKKEDLDKLKLRPFPPQIFTSVWPTCWRFEHLIIKAQSAAPHPLWPSSLSASCLQSPRSTRPLLHTHDVKRVWLCCSGPTASQRVHLCEVVYIFYY